MMQASTGPWRYLPAKSLPAAAGKWMATDFDDTKWKSGKAPIGYGEDELTTRKGTIIAEKGQSFVFRRTVEIPADLLEKKGAIFRLSIASDDNANVY